MIPVILRHYARIKSFKILTDYKVFFRFKDDTERIIDLEPHLWGPVFEPVRRRAFFRKAYLSYGVISWPNGADFAPETIYHDIWPRRPKRKNSAV